MKNLLEPRVHVFIEKENKFLFLRRLNSGCYDGYWCLPTGRIEKGETPAQAVQRETLEEVGLHIDPIFVATLYAKVPDILSDKPGDYEDLCLFQSNCAYNAPKL